MFQYTIFKIDNKYYLYSVHNDRIVSWRHTFNRLFREYVDFVHYQVKYAGMKQKQFALHIRKF